MLEISPSHSNLPSPSNHASLSTTKATISSNGQSRPARRRARIRHHSITIFRHFSDHFPKIPMTYVRKIGSVVRVWSYAKHAECSRPWYVTRTIDYKQMYSQLSSYMYVRSFLNMWVQYIYRCVCALWKIFVEFIMDILIYGRRMS